MRDVIEDAYGVLRHVTPLPNGLDCGKLCGGRCCKGTANDGMELFHGEEKRFLHDPDFTVRERDGRKLLICSGSCFPSLIFPTWSLARSWIFRAAQSTRLSDAFSFSVPTRISARS